MMTLCLKKESNMKKPLILFIAVLAVASFSCSLAGGATPDPNILFQDDFSDTSSGWDRVNNSDSVTDYADGAYRIWVNKPQYDIWANPGKSFAGDVRIEVDASKKAGPDDNDFGVICRYEDINNFYFFHITSDGYAIIGKITKDHPGKALLETLTGGNRILPMPSGDQLPRIC